MPPAFNEQHPERIVSLGVEWAWRLAETVASPNQAFAKDLLLSIDTDFFTGRSWDIGVLISEALPILWKEALQNLKPEELRQQLIKHWLDKSFYLGRMNFNDIIGLDNPGNLRQLQVEVGDHDFNLVFDPNKNPDWLYNYILKDPEDPNNLWFILNDVAYINVVAVIEAKQSGHLTMNDHVFLAQHKNW
jgi:hypothetical protein